MLTENKVENIYLGEYVPPTPTTFEYSYDFRNKSVSQVKTDGWVFKQGESWCTINSSGLQRPTRGQGASNKLRLYKTATFTGATKVTLQWVVNGTAQDWGNYGTMGIGEYSAWTGYFGSSYSTTTYSGYQNAGNGWVSSGNVKYSGNPSSGTYTITVVADLVNKTLTLSKTGQSNLSMAITDTDISNIRSSNCHYLDVGHDIGSVYTQTFYIKIEY